MFGQCCREYRYGREYDLVAVGVLAIFDFVKFTLDLAGIK
jgi:hypothetical protein